MLGFHCNELVEQKNNAIDAYLKTLEESAPLYKIWHDSLNHVSQQTALDLYKRCLIEEHSLHNVQSKIRELKLIIEWYKNSNKWECLKQTTNMVAELERQMQHTLDVEKRMHEEEKQIHNNIAEVKKYFDKYRIAIGIFKNEVQLNLEKYQKKQNDTLLKDVQNKHKKLLQTDGPKKDDGDKNDKDKNKKLIYKGFFTKLKKRATKYARSIRFGKMYEDSETGLWWSKDLSTHGASCFKVFEKTAKSFEWVFNADHLGNRIFGQHKGPVGISIPFKEVIFKT